MRRRYRYPGRNTGTGFTVFIIVIILAIVVGYAGTKYIVYPYLLGNGSVSEEQGQNADGVGQSPGTDTMPSVIIDQQNVQNPNSQNQTDQSNQSQQNNQTQQQNDQSSQQGTGAVGGGAQTISSSNGPFSVQFGSFSTRNGAEEMSAELTGKGIYSYVYESGGSFKVLGLPYSSEAKAKEAASVVSSVVSDVFVVNLSNIIQ